MNNSTRITRARNPLTRSHRGIGCWRRLLAASLTLGVAAVLQTQTVRADSVIFDDQFNNATNNIANNDLGVGGGFTAFAYDNGVNAFYMDAFETTTYNGLSGGFAVLADSTIGDRYSSLDTSNSFNLNGGGTTFELSGVSFSTNTPIANGGGGASGNVDRLMWGVSTIAPAGAWLSAGLPGAIPTGFWIQFNSDSLITGTGAGGWSGTSTLFYKDTGTNRYQLCSWKFDNLTWSNGIYNFSRTLDVKLTLSGTGWALNITGDTATNLPISYSGTYAAGGVLAGTTNPVAINPLLLNGINNSYLGGFNQTANPGIAMQIDEAKVTQLGTLVVTTPQFNTPEYGYNTNIVLAGESVTLISTVTDSAGTPTLKWQMEDMSSPGTFTDLPSGSATNVNVNTSALTGSVKGIQLVAKDGGISVTSAVVKLTVNAASGPALTLGPVPSYIDVYHGQGASFTATFTGNLPIYYQWQHSSDGGTWTNIPSSINPTATNNTLVIASAGDIDALYYQIVASNSVGVTHTADSFNIAYANILAGSPAYLWSQAIPFGGLNSDQILTNFPSTYKIAGAMYAANGGPALVVTTGQGNITFGPNGLTSLTVSGGSGYGTGANAPQTGNANFNTCLNSFYFNTTPHVITMSNLVVGQKYQMQLFALDDTSAANKAHTSNWQDPLNGSDVSMTFKMGDNVYILGTFTASNAVQTFQQNFVDTNIGNFNCMVLRAVGGVSPLPYFASQPTNQSLFAANASLVGVAGGDASLGTISYQWMAGPVGGPYSNLPEGVKYNGTTTPSLTISNLVTADGNQVYVVKATNGGGSLNSREVVLVIQSVPPAPAPGSYAAAALLNNPVALWMFTETNNPSSGILKGYDYTGNGHFVTYRTAVQNGFNGILGPQSPSYPGFATNETAAKTANNNTSYVSVPPLNDTNLATTVAMWINPNSGETGNYAHGLIGGRNNTVAGQIWQLGYSAGSGNLGYNWNDASATYGYNSGLAPVQGTWNFVAMVITANNATFYLYYLNGAGQAILSKAVNAAGNTTPITMAGGTTVIGSDPYDLTSRGFNGAIASVALYNSALSESQVQTMFAVGVGISTNFPPAFVTQPAATNIVFPGYNLQLSATTSAGTPPVTNQWTFNGTNLVDGYYGPNHETHIVGSTSNVLSITYITTNWAGTYNLILSNSVTFVASSNSVVIVSQPAPAPAANLVGNWFAGPQNLTNQATASDPGNIYSGKQITGQGSYTWVSDLPGVNNGGSSINLNNTGIVINNTSTNDAGYQNTFDVGISNQFSVSFWAKGWPGGWNAFVSKYGEGPGWQLRNDGNNNVSPCWTIRGNGGTVAQGLAVFGNSEDMAATSLTYGNDGRWHFYCGTYSLSAAQRQLFVDGALVAYTTGEGQYNTSPATHLVLGAKDQPPGTNNFTGYFTGEMYDVRIYNTNLNASQQASIYGTPPLPTVLAFTTQPVATNNTFPGFNIQLKATSTGYAPITNQWQLNGANLADGNYGSAQVIGSKSNVLTIISMTTNFAGTYNLLLSNQFTNLVSSNAVVNVLQPTPPPAGNLVGKWFAGAQSLADVSGHNPGVHDGSQIQVNNANQGSYGWASDLPAINSGGSSISLTNTGILINNTSTNDAGYENTFDVGISNQFSVTCWAKGFPGSWNAWVSKFGETSPAPAGGWQLRQYAGNGTSTFTLRGTGSAQAGGDDQQGSINSNDGKWHLYVGTYNPTTKVRSLYVDGTLSVQSTDNGQYTTAPECHLAIGAKDQPPGSPANYNKTNNFTGYFTGEMYDVRIYNVELTINQQAYLYSALASLPVVNRPVVSGNNLVLSWTGSALLTATNIAGPWTTNTVTSPATNPMTLHQQFFKAQQ